ncbi:MAG: cysteine peptidase family C39 domain-containing protein [Planctomycetota bacterium]
MDRLSAVFLALQGGVWILAFLYGIRRRRRDPSLSAENALKRCKGFSAMTLGLILLSAGFLFPLLNDSICEALPIATQRWLHWIEWSLILTSFGLASGLLVGLAIPGGPPRQTLVAVFIPPLHVLFAVVALRNVDPVHHALDQVKEEQGVVLQSTGYTCVAATLANVARHHGLFLSERDAAELLLTTRLGTSRGPIRYALSQLDIAQRTYHRDEERDLSKVPVPAFLFVDHPSVGREGHAVGYFGERAGGYEIWDPLGGRSIWSAEQVNAHWHGSAIACEFRPR